MEKHKAELFELLRRDGSPATEKILCGCLWSIFRNPGEEIPWYFFHESGKGVYFNLVEETEFDWLLSEDGILTMESEGSAISFLALQYKGIFLGLFQTEMQRTILLVDSEGAQEQMLAFSN